MTESQPNTHTAPSPLDELDARQDDVLARLDELNAQIMELLKEFGHGESDGEATPDDQGARTCQSLLAVAAQEEC